MIYLYTLDITPYLEGGWESLLEGLPARRQQRALACRQAGDGARSAAAGWLLQYALTCAGIPREGQVFTENPWGKPGLLGRDSPQFSLSHSGKWVACAVGESPLGVDIESPRCTLAMARRFFHPGEVAAVEALPPPEQPDALCRLWVAKEAFLKAEGLGLHLPLSSFCVQLAKDDLSLAGDGRTAAYRFHEYPLGEGYRLCLCGEGERPALTAVTDGPQPKQHTR